MPKETDRSLIARGSTIGKLIYRIVGDWFGIMSGGLAIPLTFLALFDVYSQRATFGILALIALWVVVIKIGLRNHALHEKLRPKFKLACNPNIAGSVTPGCTRDGIQVIFRRVKVESDGVESLIDCRGQLIEIEKDSIPRWGNDAQLLTFAPAGAADATSKTIRQHSPEYLDVLVITERNEIIPATPNWEWRFAPPKNIFEDHGDYLLTVVISAHNSASIKTKLRFTWTGDWKSASLSIVQLNDSKV